MPASMTWRYLGHIQLLSRAKHSLTAIAQKEVCPRDEIADPPGTNVLLIDRHGFTEGFVSFRTLYVVQLSLVRFAPNREIVGRPPQWQGTVRDSVFQACVFLLKLDDQTLPSLVDKGTGEESRCHRGRNFKWCVEDDVRGACSSDVHHLVQKPISADKIHFTHAYQSPRARQIAARVVCGS